VRVLTCEYERYLWKIYQEALAGSMDLSVSQTAFILHERTQFVIQVLIMCTD